ncbi:YlcI/YnfO family protein [Mycolicibacterium bacteremicum]|nr:YlcI/YnfO family protein [Mycolicibacterium bacteremicum]
MPNQPRTPLRSFRIPDELYAAAQAKAEEKGESVSDVVRRALERYVKRP